MIYIPTFFTVQVETVTSANTGWDRHSIYGILAKESTIAMYSITNQMANISLGYDPIMAYKFLPRFILKSLLRREARLILKARTIPGDLVHRRRRLSLMRELHRREWLRLN